MTDIRNKGRCGRCAASYRVPLNDKEYATRYLRCLKYGGFCSGVARNCQEPPNGIKENELTQSAKDKLEKLRKGIPL